MEGREREGEQKQVLEDRKKIGRRGDSLVKLMAGRGEEEQENEGGGRGE